MGGVAFAKLIVRPAHIEEALGRCPRPEQAIWPDILTSVAASWARAAWQPATIISSVYELVDGLDAPSASSMPNGDRSSTELSLGQLHWLLARSEARTQLGRVYDRILGRNLALKLRAAGSSPLCRAQVYDGILAQGFATTIEFEQWCDEQGGVYKSRKDVLKRLGGLGSKILLATEVLGDGMLVLWPQGTLNALRCTQVEAALFVHTMGVAHAQSYLPLVAFSQSLDWLVDAVMYRPATSDMRMRLAIAAQKFDPGYVAPRPMNQPRPTAALLAESPVGNGAARVTPTPRGRGRGVRRSISTIADSEDAREMAEEQETEL